MKTRAVFSARNTAFFAAALSLSLFPRVWAAGDIGRNNPASKIYVSDITGESQIAIGQKIEDLVKKSVYNVQGTIIETKAKSSDSLVYSNGTGVFFDAETRVEVRRFLQEPFTPNRTDMEVEPSVSQTQAYVLRGLVGICTSKLVAGSNMTYHTPHAMVNIRGRKLVIEASDEITVISMIEGDSTVHGGALDMGGRILRAGERAVIQPGAPGQPNVVEIEKIPGDRLGQLEEKAAIACMAKRTVYFDTRENGEPAAGNLANAFGGGNESTQEIVAITVVPTNVSPDITISPSTLPNPPPR
ncbi:MAG TPA: hypothetical protein VHO24_04785 [Opitutaceae bacterium]|nr:hypothetical protein [Opitutaceae bacterium]